jgi:hypothetical protein
LLYGFLKALPCRVVNRPRPGAGQRWPESRDLAEALGRSGFARPSTLVTSSGPGARRFFERNARRVLLTSPGAGGTVLVRDGARLLADGNRPFRLQALPEGRWRRVWVAGREVFATETEPPASPGAPLPPMRPAKLLAAFVRRCVKLASLLELDFVELQMVCGRAGDCVMAVQPLPNLARCDGALQQAITAALAGVLTGERKARAAIPRGKATSALSLP